MVKRKQSMTGVLSLFENRHVIGCSLAFTSSLDSCHYWVSVVAAVAVKVLVLSSWQSRLAFGPTLLAHFWFWHRAAISVQGQLITITSEAVCVDDCRNRDTLSSPFFAFLFCLSFCTAIFFLCIIITVAAVVAISFPFLFFSFAFSISSLVALSPLT